ncbi:TolC family protein [Cerasicoccus fimbriatus]|uniref:TolC family protein n=1 Tax=Cerasicoccus fimbriatus TaxID=3014554 RepID=UPI0022B2D874|nr:TolC family protein [Cerasicoccus sp. TK19100]
MTGRLTWAELRRELTPYTGRDWLVLRMVLAVLLSTVLVMAFQIENGWLSLYLCFVFAKPTTKQTLVLGTALIVMVLPIVILALCLLNYVADPPGLRLLAMTLVIYGTFYGSNIMTEGDIIRNLSLVFLTVLILPDSYADPGIWIEGAMWLVPMVLAGLLPLMFITVLVPPEKALPAELRPPSAKYGFRPNWKTNPEHHIYALKGTFAAMGTYIIYTTLNFQAIQTALMTCIVLGLPTTEQIIHKTWLRITGAVIGASLALVGAIWAIPQSNELWMLLLVVGAGSALAAWVTLSSPRISYAGRQIALAQFMLITHSFGPATDLSVLVDRLLGILLGNVMMGLTYKYLWTGKTRSGAALQSALPVLAVAAIALMMTGCEGSASLAPTTPSRPWKNTTAESYPLPTNYGMGAQMVEFDPGHEYTLSELADLAQRNNPKTRVAWERARAMAGGVGVAESAYYPQINLMVAAGYEQVAFPLPPNIFQQGYFYSEIAILRPELQLDWLLYDFGRQDAIVQGARESAIAQNFAFNETHQQVLFNVCSAYYKLISVRSQQKVLQATLDESELVQRSTKAGLEQGFATKAQLLQAEMFVAQCVYDVTVLKGELRKAQIALAESIGADPGEIIQVKDLADSPLPENFDRSVDSLVDFALAHRPDLRAKVAELRAAEASVDQVDAQNYPVIIASGNAGPVYSAFSADDTPWVDSFQAQYGVGVALQMPVFDGFRQQNLKISAQADQRAVEASLLESRNAAVSQVWSAYTDYENARSRLLAAEAVIKASEASQEAALASFKQGFADVTDVQAQQLSLLEARENYNTARTDVFLSASLLQLATGQLAVDRLQ